MRRRTFHKRWSASNVRYLVRVRRKTYEAVTELSSDETSYYVSNAASTKSHTARLKELGDAIRGHWCVEANNWVRDVTMGEDLVQVRDENQAQVLATLRGLVLTLVHTVETVKKTVNIRATLERMCFTPSKLKSLFKRATFL